MALLLWAALFVALALLLCAAGGSLSEGARAAAVRTTQLLGRPERLFFDVWEPESEEAGGKRAEAAQHAAGPRRVTALLKKKARPEQGHGM
jgi:hypothetical protein